MSYRRRGSSIRQRKNNSNTWVRSSGGPVLKGGHVKRTWKRGNQDHAASQQDAAAGSDTVLQRRGQNKLVLKQEPVGEKKMTAAMKETDASPVKIMKKRGRNQLVLAGTIDKTDTREDEKVADNAIGTVAETTTMKHRGKNQLVLEGYEDQDTMVPREHGKKSSVEVVKSANSESIAYKKRRIGNQIVLDSHGDKAKAACHKEGTLAVEVEGSIDSAMRTNMKKRGRNQLVLEPGSKMDSKTIQEKGKVSVDMEEHQAKLQVSTTERKANSVADKHTTDMKKRGRNKLVKMGGSQALGGRKTKHDIKGKHPRRAHTASNARAKRVKLNVSGETEDLVEHTVSAMPAQGAAGLEEIETKKLTEFAYRETSKKAARGGRKSHGWVRRGTISSSVPVPLDPKGRRNMGLVRVIPDLATTPVCPTFARGIPCDNEKCTKRHDVPKEAATPICSFFQRNGQCLKRDTCPFLHIKVNVRTTVCPSFSLLGFCQDTECRMKHVRQRANKSIKRPDSPRKT